MARKPFISRAQQDQFARIGESLKAWASSETGKRVRAAAQGLGRLGPDIEKAREGLKGVKPLLRAANNGSGSSRAQPIHRRKISQAELSRFLKKASTKIFVETGQKATEESLRSSAQSYFGCPISRIPWRAAYKNLSQT